MFTVVVFLKSFRVVKASSLVFFWPVYNGKMIWLVLRTSLLVCVLRVLLLKSLFFLSQFYFTAHTLD